MLSNLVIGLREGLEAALVVSILIAYAVRSGRRDLLAPLWLGVLGAVVASVALATGLTWGTRGLDDRTEEVIAGTLSVLTVALVTWMIFWMAGEARHLAGHLRNALDSSVSKASVAGLAALAVGREGIETALFLWASTTAAAGGSTTPILGALLGLGVATMLGYLIYHGALRLDLATFFRWTGALLVLIAAGVLGSGIRDLQEAGVLPFLRGIAYDVSGAISEDGVVAALLKGFVGFSPAPSWLQLLAWAGYAVVVLALFLRRSRRH